MDAPAKVDEVVQAARAMRDDLILIARARDDQHAMRLYALGVTDAVPETTEASLQLAENTLVDLGVPMGLVLASIHERRDQFRKAFQAATPVERRNSPQPRPAPHGAARPPPNPTSAKGRYLASSGGPIFCHGSVMQARHCYFCADRAGKRLSVPAPGRDLHLKSPSGPPAASET